MSPYFLRCFQAFVVFVSAFGGGTISSAENDAPSKEAKEIRAPRNSPNYAFLCLNSKADPKSDILKQKLTAWLDLKSPDNLTKFQVGRKKDATITTFEADGKSATIARINSPIPKDDIDYACANSTHWPEARQKLEAHTGHLNVTASGKFEDAIDLALFVSRVLAACTEAYDTAGVYWGHGTVVHSPEFFREQIKDSNRVDLPIHAWIGFLTSAGKKPDTFDLYTRGLDVFGVMEIEVIGMKGKPSDVAGMVAALCDQELKHGNVIKDGHSIDSPSGEKIQIQHANSAIGREGKVLRIEF